MERSRRRRRRRSRSRPLRLAWLLLLLLFAGAAFYLKAPASWLAAVGLQHDGGEAVVASVQLPALPAGNVAARDAWELNRAAAVAVPAGKPLVAVVLTGLGRGGEATDAAIALPAPFSLAFAPTQRPFDDALQRARAAGHEALVDLPMEGERADPDPGPGALLTLLDVPQNFERLDAILGQGEPLAGVAILGGERFLMADDLAQPVLARLAERGLMVVAPRVEGALGEPGDLALLLADRHYTTETASVDVLLAEVERIALTQGSGVAVVPAEPAVLARLGPWASSLAARGFVLAPATQVLERRLAAP